MNSQHENEKINHSCEEVDISKNLVTPPPWTQFCEKIEWAQFLPLFVYHVGFCTAAIIYSCGLYSVPVKWATIIWAPAVHYGAIIGVTAGAHRLWSHCTYKANLVVRVTLMLLYSMFGMYSLFHWIRDHRVHHKYTETDADPHNATRGFFFSHIGWLLQKKHPECVRRSEAVDMTDIIADPVVMFQKKYDILVTTIFSFVIPMAVPIILWEETIMHALLTQCFIRIVVSLHIAFTGTSVLHIWGSRPYNRSIKAADNPIIAFLTAGERSHNYHHTFPWDYKSSEFSYLHCDFATAFIDTMSVLGWVTDLKTPSPEFIETVVQRIGYKSETTFRKTSMCF